MPIFPVNLFKGEILGYERIKDLAYEIYGDKNPLERFFAGEPYDLIKSDGAYEPRMKLPFASRENVELSRVADELIIRVGGFKRHLLLPRQVAACSSVKAKLEGQHLSIFFRGENHGQETA